MAEKSAVEQTTLPPLHESVDVDAIESLFEPTAGVTCRTGTVAFPYYGYCVTVTYDPGATGTIEVEAIDFDSIV